MRGGENGGGDKGGGGLGRRPPFDLPDRSASLRSGYCLSGSGGGAARILKRVPCRPIDGGPIGAMDEVGVEGSIAAKAVVKGQHLSSTVPLYQT